MRSSRLKKLTPKAMEIYEQKVADFSSKFETSSDSLKTLIQECDSVTSQTPVHIFNATRLSLVREFEQFKKIYLDYGQYLVQTGTEDSLSENSSLTEKYLSICGHVECCVNKLDSCYETFAKQNAAASVYSVSETKSHTSSKSKTSTILARKLAKAEAAKAKLEFSEREALLKLQQSELEEQQQIAAAAAARKKSELQIQLKLIEERKETAAAKAEAEALESSLGSNGNSVKLSQLPKSDPEVRTAEFVTSQTLPTQTEPPLGLNPTVPDFVPGNMEQSAHYINPTSAVLYSQGEPMIIPQQSRVVYSPFTPAVIPNQDNSSTLVSDFSKFLLKKDLLLSRLSVFTEKPENYMVWKNSFKHIMVDLGVSSFEELDLLVKWLGPESSNQVLNIRAAHANNPNLGLRMAWERLDDKFGCPENVDESLKKKLHNFPTLSNKDSKKLYDLADLLSEIEALKQDPKYSSILGYYDASSGVIPIVNKLPYSLREKWVTHASNYKRKHSVVFPPFSVFCSFVRDMSKIRNDPSLRYDTSNREFTSRSDIRKKEHVISRKTEVMNQTANSHQQNKCPLHKTNHSLNNCRAFRQKSFEERKKWLKEKGYCFKCCDSVEHKSKDCKTEIKCSACQSSRHPSALHIDKSVHVECPPVSPPSFPLQTDLHSASPLQFQGGERPISGEQAVSKCTEICGDTFGGKSCSKIVLVKVYHRDDPQRFIKTYAILDDQSNKTLARSDLFHMLGIESNQVKYTMSSCSGTKLTFGQIANGYIIETLDGSSKMELPSILECNEIPNIQGEIPTSEVARYHSHLRDIADFIPPLEIQTPTLILIGRDLPEAHHVSSQLTGPKGSPYAQKLKLGWVIVGETCLGKIHKSNHVNVNKTYLLHNGRASHSQPCTREFIITQGEPSTCALDQFDPVFERKHDDNKPSLSVEDRHFLQLMEDGFVKDSEGRWSAPLPFRVDRPTLPSNKEQAVRRAKILDSSLQKNAVKREHFVNFMEKVIKNGHAEVAPPLEKDQECWFLPVFGVYHPHKPGEIRGVFDSSARCDGLSLNDVLLQGPDLTNNLLGIVLRFRREVIAIAADIQQMFYSFRVHKEHRNFLRFMWYEDNDPEKSLIQYRMCVHVFGNSPSPAVATYGLRRTVKDSDPDVKKFVNKDFYVDDALTSLPTVEEAVDLLKRTQSDLQTAGLELHKVVSNSQEVLAEFPPEQLTKSLKHIDLTKDTLPVQHTLGLSWDLEKDTFFFNVSEEQKPYTKRGMLSTINSLFDPVGFLSPITIQGKVILRDVFSEVHEWDEPLPPKKYEEWSAWKDALPQLRQDHFSRRYATRSLRDAIRIELHTFSDASEAGIAAVSYLLTYYEDGSCHIGFAMGKAKVAPLRGHTIPRLELCAAVLASETTETVKENLDIKLHAVKYYTDSKVVLGYIHNQSKRFYTYVSNRVDKIRTVCRPNQWNFVPTHLNPADDGSRGLKVSNLQDSKWLTGPQFLLKETATQDQTDFPLISPDDDVEIRKNVKALATNVSSPTLGTNRFEKFSSWKCLVRSVACLRHIAASYGGRNKCNGWHDCKERQTVQQFEDSANFIIREVQQEVYGKDILALKENNAIPKSSPIASLLPFIGSDDILRVGGRLKNAPVLISREKHPIIIPGKHHIARLLTIHFHEEVQHQGRHFTEGAIRAGGFWITGGKRLVSSIIYRCVKCRKLRGKFEGQKMADLPSDRLEEAPPFTYVGLDVFGPWSVTTRRTRGGSANSKRWAVLFTCLCVRAVHIEVIEDLSSSTFINALRRFVAIRGKVKQFRSDRGTNFVGSTADLRIDAINIEDGHVKKYLYDTGVTWVFNTPHSSHMGRVWERLIGVARRILDSMLLDVRNLTHEILVTLMAEVSAIVNSRPLVPVSYDQEVPEILCPATLLTQKSDNMMERQQIQLDVKDMFRAQWKRVQHLADTFWLRWKREYLQTLQPRKKWLNEKANIQAGDVVLLRDSDVGRTSWPIARVVRVFPSDDGYVRKCEVKVIRDGKPVLYIRPVVEIVLLFSPQNCKDDNNGI